MQMLNTIFLLIANIALSQGSGCRDKDELACNRLRAADANICQDASIARNTCPKLCGTCRIACYSCADVDDPRNCTVTSECSADQECIISEHLSNDFHISYKMGCVDKTVCSSLLQHYSFGRRDTDGNARLHLHCCSTDLCNNQTFNTLHYTTHYPTGGSGCFDRRNCYSYHRSQCSTYPSWFRQNCARYCGFCGSTAMTTSYTTYLPTTIATFPPGK